MDCGDWTDYGSGSEAVMAYNACVAASRVEVGPAPPIVPQILVADAAIPLPPGCTYTYPEPEAGYLMMGVGDIRRIGNLSTYGQQLARAWYSRQYTCPVVEVAPPAAVAAPPPVVAAIECPNAEGWSAASCPAPVQVALREGSIDAFPVLVALVAGYFTLRRYL